MFTSKSINKALKLPEKNFKKNIASLSALDLYCLYVDACKAVCVHKLERKIRRS